MQLSSRSNVRLFETGTQHLFVCLNVWAFVRNLWNLLIIILIILNFCLILFWIPNNFVMFKYLIKLKFFKLVFLFIYFFTSVFFRIKWYTKFILKVLLLIGNVTKLSFTDPKKLILCIKRFTIAWIFFKSFIKLSLINKYFRWSRWTIFCIIYKHIDSHKIKTKYFPAMF